MAALTDIVMQCHIELEGQFQRVVSVVRWAALPGRMLLVTAELRRMMEVRPCRRRWLYPRGRMMRLLGFPADQEEI